MRERAWGSRSTGVKSNNEDNRPQTREKHTQRRDYQLMDVMNQAGDKWDPEYPKSSSNLLGRARRTENQFVSRADVYSVVEKLMLEVIKKAGECVFDIAERTVVDALKACNVGRKEASIKAALSSALNELLVSIPDDLSVIRESLEGAIVQVISALKSLVIIASAVANATAAMAPIAWNAAKIMKQEV